MENERVTAILKTWPAFMPPKKVLQVFTHDWDWDF